jgi:hypothetical protein
MKKTLSILLIAVLVIGGLAWYFVTHRLDGAIEEAIETAGYNTFGTEVSVGSLKTDIKNGTLTISDITVANPPGYNNANAFTLSGIEASVDYSNFDIKRLLISQPDIVVEEKGGGTNFSELMAGLESGNSEPEPAAGEEEPTIITIRHFRMNESRAAFESKSLDRYTDLKVDSVELRDLKGTPTEVSQAIANEVLNEVISAAAIELVKAKASEKIGDIFGKDDN